MVVTGRAFNLNSHLSSNKVHNPEQGLTMWSINMTRVTCYGDKGERSCCLLQVPARGSVNLTQRI